MLSDDKFEEIRHFDGPTLQDLKPPAQRAAYSDRMAWQMAVLAQLAYVEFETTPFKEVRELAKELAATNDADAIEERLKPLLQLFHRSTVKNDGEATGEDFLQLLLDACGFELVGTFFNQSLNLLENTEGFVATCNGPHGKYAVLSIRGTTSWQDWRLNLDAKSEPLPGYTLRDNETEKERPRIHPGFYKAYDDASKQISELLEKVGDIPLFITGHSLGGAVAVLATWYQETDRLAACYTFGAPRVGNHHFNEKFRTPIYRIVNAFDPVAMLPPSENFVSVLKFGLRGAARIGLAPVFDRAADFVMGYQGYRHPGDLRFMTDGEIEADGSYPTVQYHKVFGVGDRSSRIAKLAIRGGLKRLDRYHEMTTYRRKLRYHALMRLNKWPSTPDEGSGDVSA